MIASLDHDEFSESASVAASATLNPSGEVNLVCDRCSIIATAQVTDLKKAFERIEKIDGYRWIAINQGDSFGANPLSLGSKAGILNAVGNVLKAPDSPRNKA